MGCRISNPFFVDWSKTIENKKSKKILIPGCGLGHDVIYLSKLGFDVYACDFSSTAVKILRNKVEKNNLSTKVIKENFFLNYLKISKVILII